MSKAGANGNIDSFEIIYSSATSKMSYKNALSLNIFGIVSCLIIPFYVALKLKDFESRNFIMPTVVLGINAFLIYITTGLKIPSKTFEIVHLINAIIWAFILALLIVLFILVRSFEGPWEGGFAH